MQTTMSTTKRTITHLAALGLCSALATACAVDGTGEGVPPEGAPATTAAAATNSAAQRAAEPEKAPLEAPKAGEQEDTTITPWCSGSGETICWDTSTSTLVCTDLDTDFFNCGACGNVCKGIVYKHTFIGACVGGRCID